MATRSRREPSTAPLGSRARDADHHATPGAIAASGSPPGRRGGSRATEPSIFVIFGATGDLAKRKILPALFELHRHGMTDRGMRHPGRGSRCGDRTTRGFAPSCGTPFRRTRVHSAATSSSWIDANVFYQPIGNAESGDFVGTEDAHRRTGARSQHRLANASFYLSLPPQAFPPTIAGLGAAGLNHSSGWTRLVIEKPSAATCPSARGAQPAGAPVLR